MTSSFFAYPEQSADVPARADDSVLLGSLNEAEWGRLLAYTIRRSFRAGERLMTLGEMDRSLDIVAQGTVEVRAPMGNRRTAFGVHTVLGEVAFFDGAPRSADVYALTDGQLVSLSYEQFTIFAAREPVLSRLLLLDLGRILAGRLRRVEAAQQRE